MAEGELQDVHWRWGLFDYFPTYTLGNVIAGMVYNRMKRDLDFQDVVRRGETESIKIWLKENINKWGATYSPKELQMKVLGDVYNPEYLVGYLEQKYQT